MRREYRTADEVVKSVSEQAGAGPVLAAQPILDMRGPQVTGERGGGGLEKRFMGQCCLCGAC